VAKILLSTVLYPCHQSSFIDAENRLIEVNNAKTLRRSLVK
jgi:hypothetical protein